MADTTVVVCGNCTADPEVRYGQSGTAVTSFGVAVSSRRKNASGEWENGDPSFYDVSCFDKLAEHVAASFVKGQRVMVYGRLRQSSWETDGQRRTKIEIVAEEVGPSLKWGPISAGDGSVRTGGGKFTAGNDRSANVSHVEEPF